MAKFIVQAIYRDYPIAVEVENFDDLNKIIDRLDGIGAVPPTRVNSEAAQIEQERAAPVCPFHGPMKPSSKVPGTFYCASKMGDGKYCKSKTDAQGNLVT